MENYDVRVVCIDARGDVEGRYLADAFHTVPTAHQPGYLLAMRRIARQEGVDVILPQTTAETVVLSQNKEYFEDIGVKVAVSDAEAVRVANDKGLLMEVAKEVGVPVPEFYRPKSWMELTADAAKLGYPRNKVVVKPTVSNGMRGLRIVTPEKWTVARFLSEKPSGTEISLDQLGDILCRGEWPEILVSEFLPGAEYTVDMFSGGPYRLAIPRRRVRVRDGITTRAQVELSENFHGDKLVDWSKKLGGKLGLKYCYGFQFREGLRGMRLLECNPRIQGGSVTAKLSGANIIMGAVLVALGEDADFGWHVKDGTVMQRYWGFIRGGR
jgi:carbamoyl-phosphate synthase large subunit